ncbi:MAG: hypothetical protein HY567_01025 [Candidatus Kerfeldbacteria bacterium]|nr:hypothetical protein [Candidatus Kerfeldbacteria bacterium]
MLRLDPLDERAVVKPLVCSDNHALAWVGALGKASLQQSHYTASGVRIAWSQFSVPVIFALSLEAQQRMIGGTTPLDGVVADARLFLFAIEHQHRGVDVENESRRQVRAAAHASQKFVVQHAQTRQHLRRCAQQKSSQAGRVRITGQPRQVLEHPVLPQQLRSLEPFEPKDHRVEQRQQHLANAVTVVALPDTNMLCDRALESNAGQKPMQQVDTAIVRQILRAKRDGELTRSATHYTEPYLLSSFQCKAEKSKITLFSPLQTRLA